MRANCAGMIHVTTPRLPGHGPEGFRTARGDWDEAVQAIAAEIPAGAVLCGYSLGARLALGVSRRRLDLGGLVGGLAAGGIYASVASSTGSHDIDQRAFFLLSSLGIVSGLGGTYFLTRNMDPDSPRRRSEDPSSTLGSMTPVLSPVKGGFSGGLRGVF